MNFDIITHDVDIDELESEIGGCAIDDLEEKFQLPNNDLPELRQKFLDEYKDKIQDYQSISDVYLSIADRWEHGQIKFYSINMDNNFYFAASLNAEVPQVYYDEYLAEEEDYERDCYWFDLK